jgi:hypothetical protein
MVTSDAASGKVSGPGWLEAAAETFAISIWIGALFLTPLSILVSVCYLPHWAAVLWLVLLVQSRRTRRGRLLLLGCGLQTGLLQRPALLRGARPPRSSSPWTRPAGRRRSRATRWPSALHTSRSRCTRRRSCARAAPMSSVRRARAAPPQRPPARTRRGGAPAARPRRRLRAAQPPADCAADGAVRVQPASAARAQVRARAGHVGHLLGPRCPAPLARGPSPH